MRIVNLDPGVVGLQSADPPWDKRGVSREDPTADRIALKLPCPGTWHLIGFWAGSLGRLTAQQGWRDRAQVERKPESDVTWTANPRRVTTSTWHRALSCGSKSATLSSTTPA